MHGESSTKVMRPFDRLELSALGASLRLSTDVPGLAELLRQELGSIVRSDFAGEPDLQLQVAEAELEQGSLPIEAAFGIVYRAWLDRLDRYAILHGAALVKDGRALLLAGPTGSGKTTLSLALMARGFALLSDDFTPLALDSKRIAPFPKALGVRAGAASRLAARSGVQTAPDAARTAIDAQQLNGMELAKREARLAAIVLMNGAATPPQPRDPYPFYVLCAGDGGRVQEALLALPGATLQQRTRERIDVRLDPTLVSYDRLELWLNDHQAELLEYGTAAAASPGRSGRAQLSALSPSTALVLLLREIQNRRVGGALMHRFNDDLTRFSQELARAIAGLPLTWLVAADPDVTAQLLEEWFEAAAQN